MRADRRLLAVLLAGAAVWLATLVVLLGSQRYGLIDLQVYRTGGRAWLHGIPLYDPSFPVPLDGPRLPFTYPPLAAVLFAVLAGLPWEVAVAVVVGCGIAGLLSACWLAAARLAELGGPGATPVALFAGAAVVVAPLLEPVRETLSFGQINLLLTALIAADCLLRRTPWPRGALIGLAAAVKLTPAAFLLFFLARRQWRPVLVAAGSFLVAGVVGLLLAPRDSARYWLGVLLDPSRIGRPEFASNQSLRGMLARFGLPTAVEAVAWLGLSAVVGEQRRDGDDVGALLVTAAAALLVSPVSWSHHWVWAVLGLVWFAECARRTRSPAVAALLAGTVAVFAAAPFWWFPYRDARELSWSFGQHLLGNAYVWLGLAVVVVGAVGAIRARRTQDTDKAVLAG